MNIFTDTILLIASTLILGQMEDGMRKLPPDLTAWIYNKSDEELAYEDCMSAYTICTTFERSKKDANYQICAVDKKTQGKASFRSLCEMIYENCKNVEGNWGYFHDGPCIVEFIAVT